MRTPIILLFFGLMASACSTSSKNLNASIEKVWEEQKNISTFMRLVEKQGGLSSLYNTSDQITLFIPNDEAFSLLGNAVLDNLVRDINNDKLKRILLSHTIQGKITAAKALKNKDDILWTLAATPLNLSVNKAKIITSYKIQGGYIHIIDRVLQR